MARLDCFMSVFLVFFTAILQPSASNLSKVMAQTNRPTGIFMLIEGGTYTFNFTEARAACSFLNVTIATKAQMQEAVQHGLETCKFGWVAEKTAVVPRIKPDNKCGTGKTGLVLWNAPADKKFAVFCFNASALTDQNPTSKPSTAGPQSPRSSTLLESSNSTSTSAPLTLRSSTQAPPSVERPAAPSASDAITVTTDSTSFSVEHLSTHIPASPHGLITSKPSGITFGFSSSTQSLRSSASPGPGLQPSISSTNPLLDAAHITLISLSIILLLLTAATAWWCYKSTIVRRCVWRQKDHTETEMWRNDHSEAELPSEDGAETEDAEEPGMKYSSDIALCVNPCAQTNHSE